MRGHEGVMYIDMALMAAGALVFLLMNDLVFGAVLFAGGFALHHFFD